MLFSPSDSRFIFFFFLSSKANLRLSGNNLEGTSTKEWKSVVLPKVYEEKLQKLQAELEKKVFES